MARVFVIQPQSDISIEKAHYDLERLVNAEEIYFDSDFHDKYSLFNFGMLFALMQYSHHFNSNKKMILVKDIKPTPNKSFGNVLLDILNKGNSTLSQYIINEKKAFLISPVRSTTDKLAMYLRRYKRYLLKKGFYEQVHYPIDDTNQEDPIGIRICRDNLQAEASSSTIKVFYDEKSKGSVFDLGMDFMLKYYLDPLFCHGEKRNINLINKHYIKKGGNYEKFLLDLENEN